MADLKKAEKALKAAMKHHGAVMLFNQPVDYKGLGLTDYRKFVKQPMDLGTIFQNLAWKQYETVSQVKSDVDLVWSNCIKYNRRPIDQPTRDICNEVKAEFERLWAEAGFTEATNDGVAQTPPSTSKQAVTTLQVLEKDVPNQYNLHHDADKLPARVVSDFFFCSANDAEKLVLMKARSKLGSATLVGTLQDRTSLQQETKGTEAHVIHTGAVIDWCHQYGPEGGIWVLTKLAWYKLQEPTDSYKEMFKAAALRFEICNAAVEAVKEDPEMDLSEAMDRVLATYSGAPKLDPRIRTFLASQLEAWLKNHLKEDDSDEEVGAGNGTSPQLSPQQQKRKRSTEGGVDNSPQTNGRQKRRKAEAAVAKGEGTADGLPSVSKSGRVRRAAAKKDVLSEKAPPQKKVTKAQRDRESHARRGPPPPPSRSSRTPKHLLPDIIAVWEFLQMLGGELQITAFPLWRLEAAICPGPHSSIKHPDSPPEPPDSPPEPPDRGSKPQAEQPQTDQAPQSVSDEKPNGVQQELEPGVFEPHETDGRTHQVSDAQGIADECDPSRPQSPRETFLGESAARKADPPKQIVPDVDPNSVNEQKSHGSPPLSLKSSPAGQENAVPTALGSQLLAQSQAVNHEERPKKRKRGRPRKVDTEAKKPLKMLLKIGGSDASGSSSSDLTGDGKLLRGADREGAASALVLRDVHCALLRPIEGQALGKEGTAPAAANVSLPPDESAKAGRWPQRIVEAILKAPEPVDQETWDAALQLSGGDYWQLSSSSRVALLRSLTHLALNNDKLRDIMQAKAESIQALQPKAPTQTAGTQEAVPPAVGSLEEWLAWRDVVRKSWRKPLGLDFDKRRYWSLGGAAGAWTVFVEDEEGETWGWYQGQHLCKLIRWLRSGGIDRENALIRALASAPLPRSPSFAKTFSALSQSKVPAQLTAGAEGVESEVVSKLEVQNMQADGMRGRCSPYLRGEEHWPGTDASSSLAKRIFHCVDAMLGNIPFWFQDASQLERRAHLLDRLSNASLVSEISKLLLEAEEWLYSCQCLSEEWSKEYRPHWQEEVGAANNLPDCLLLTAALQEHVGRQAQVMSRPAFMRVRDINNCQLRFPFPGDELTLFKSGILQHICRYMQILGLEEVEKSPIDTPSKPSSPGEGHAEEKEHPAEHPVTNVAVQTTQERETAGEANGRTDQEDKDPIPKLETSALSPTTEDVEQNKASKDAALTPMAGNPELQASKEANEGEEWKQGTTSQQPEGSLSDIDMNGVEAVGVTNINTVTQPSVDANGVEAQSVTDMTNSASMSQPDIEATGDRAQDVTDVTDGAVVNQPDIDANGAEVGGVTDVTDSALVSQPAPGPPETAGQPASVTPASRMTQQELSELKEQWNALKADVDKLKFVQQYTVVTVAYRRSLLSGSAGETSEMSKAQASSQQEAATDAERWPVAWLLLRRISSVDDSSSGPQLLVLPLRIDLGLPDYTVGMKEYKESLKLSWHVGQRFQMFFAGKKNSKGKQGGVFYKGTIAEVESPPGLDTAGEERDKFDPWETIKVAWDSSRGHNAGECENVSPWEIERDPDDVYQIQADKAARAAEIAAKNAPPVPVALPGASFLFPPGIVPPAPPQMGQETSLPLRGERERKRKRFDDDMEWDPLVASPPSPGGRDVDWKLQDQGPAFAAPGFNSSGLSTRVPQDVLKHISDLTKEQFVKLVGNWYRLNRGKFKIPTFAHKELDLFRVFWEVQGRGGSDAITYNKLWKDVCRTLGVNLSGQTSASFNMRQNYEKCLREFEQYLANGQYMRERESNQLPSTEVVQSSKPATYQSVPPQAQPGHLLSAGSLGSLPQFSGARLRDLGGFPPAAGMRGIQGAQLGDPNFSFTRLLSTSSVPLAEAYRMMDLNCQPWSRLVAPQGVSIPPIVGGEGWTAKTDDLPPVAAGPSPPASSYPLAHPPPLAGNTAASSRPQHLQPLQAAAGGRMASQAPWTGPQSLASRTSTIQDPLAAFLQLLNSGYTAADLHQLVDRAEKLSNPQPPTSTTSFSALLGSIVGPSSLPPAAGPGPPRGGLLDLLQKVDPGPTTRPSSGTPSYPWAQPPALVAPRVPSTVSSELGPPNWAENRIEPDQERAPSNEGTPGTEETTAPAAATLSEELDCERPSEAIAGIDEVDEDVAPQADRSEEQAYQQSLGNPDASNVEQLGYEDQTQAKKMDTPPADWQTAQHETEVVQSDPALENVRNHVNLTYQELLGDGGDLNSDPLSKQQIPGSQELPETN